MAFITTYTRKKNNYNIFFHKKGNPSANIDDKALEKRVEEIFKQLDKNHDDKLTFEEFKGASIIDPRIVRVLSIEQSSDTACPFNK